MNEQILSLYYWANVVGNLSAITLVIAGFCGVIGVMSLFFNLIDSDDAESVKKVFWYINFPLISSAFILILIFAFIPSKNYFYLKGGLTAIEVVSENKDVQEISQGVINLIKEKLNTDEKE